MTDKEVGELWAKYGISNPGYLGLSIRQAREIQELIRKLVEERKINHMNDAERGYPDEADALLGALGEFGISNEGWLK